MSGVSPSQCSHAAVTQQMHTEHSNNLKLGYQTEHWVEMNFFSIKSCPQCKELEKAWIAWNKAGFANLMANRQMMYTVSMVASPSPSSSVCPVAAGRHEGVVPPTPNDSV